MFKDKIIAAFKLKYPGVNLSKARLVAIATKIETKVVDDETKIDAALAAMDDAYAFADMAKDDDKVRTLEAKIKAPKKEEETPAEKATREAAEAAEKAVPDDTPAWAKALAKQNETLAAQLAAIQGEKVAGTIKSKATEKLKDVPVSYWGKRALPDNEEALEAFVTDVTADYTTFKQEMTEAGLSVLGTPKGGKGGGGDDKAKASDKEVAAIIQNIM